MLCIIFVYCFLNFKTKLIRNLKPLNSFNCCFVYLLWQIQNLRFQHYEYVHNFQSMCLFYYFYFRYSLYFINNFSGFIVSQHKVVVRFLLAPNCEKLVFFKSLPMFKICFKFGTQLY